MLETLKFRSNKKYKLVLNPDLQHRNVCRRAPVNRFHYDAPAASTRERRDDKLLNMDKYCSDEEFNGNASPKKKKYSLRQKRANTTRYQVTMFSYLSKL